MLRSEEKYSVMSTVLCYWSRLRIGKNRFLYPYMTVYTGYKCNKLRNVLLHLYIDIGNNHKYDKKLNYAQYKKKALARYKRKIFL